MHDLDQNARDLELELSWFARLLDLRFKLYFQPDGDWSPRELAALAPPDLADSPSSYASFLREHRLDFAERVALVLALVPHLRPHLFDIFFTRNSVFDRRFTEFGGARTSPEDDFEPTGETLAFILGGTDVHARLLVRHMLDPDHTFARRDILRPAVQHPDHPLLKAPLRLAPDVQSLLTLGRRPRPTHGAEFPAQRIETALEWSDLVLSPTTLRQVQEIQTWLTHGETLMRDWGMAAKLRPGHRSLFHGPPGTGKSMTACLLGKSTGRDVYRVDLSLTVSKYIGETEKNLARLFDRAQQRGWILFFDEADALFGKRSETHNAHDRYANQEIAFLLQRIESFDGVVILASNLRNNLDEAFSRRFESIVYFPLPKPAERHKLWAQAFSPKAALHPTVDLAAVAREHELSGGSIMNVVRHVSLMALADAHRPIGREDIARGIQREMTKEGRTT